jgi:hypothetical protein
MVPANGNTITPADFVTRLPPIDTASIDTAATDIAPNDGKPAGQTKQR